MTAFLSILHIFLCLILVAIVLVQHGKGADMGVALGGGGSQTLFGARGAGNFLTKLTSGAAALFMITSLSLSFIGAERGASELLSQPGAPESAGASEPGAPEESASATGDDVQAPAGFEAIPAPGEEPAEETD